MTNLAPHAGRRLRPQLFFSYKRSLPVPPILPCPPKSGARNSTNHKSLPYNYDQRGLSQSQLSKCYPRLEPRFQQRRQDGHEQISAAKNLKLDETLRSGQPICVAGRVDAVRTAGSKLIFYDIIIGDHGNGNLQKVQAVCQFREMEAAGMTQDQFTQFSKIVRKGDWLSTTGWPHRTLRGALSTLLVELPQLVSPALHQVPHQLVDPETRMNKRHVDMMVNPQVVLSLRVRHQIEMAFHHFFESQGFVKVNTPIISASAGGAVARSFETRATEYQNQPLHLRIAPELWLKRMVVGGLERVYEIGPSFRNEGVDTTHNPEFYTCEFYEAFSTLRDLMDKTEALIQKLNETVKCDSRSPALDTDVPFATIEFIPGLEQALGVRLPDLSQPGALDSIAEIAKDKNVMVPDASTLPALLDSLAAHYLEPQCYRPTFITHHPACMSPLSKHFTCPTTGQMVAARAELFISYREIANMYEEENSPFEQRRKLEEQSTHQQSSTQAKRDEIDEAYLEALEWGLPPTGGWGCGMDRLVMLYSGQSRMADVLSFGSLRNVVGLARRREQGRKNSH